jgi:hypothetical protein
MKLPVGNWVDLAALRNGDWVRYRPRPVRDRGDLFWRYLEPPGSSGFQLERWIPLRAGEFLQGAVAKVYAEQRVYVVTVPPPAEYASAALLAEDREGGATIAIIWETDDFGMTASDREPATNGILDADR